MATVTQYIKVLLEMDIPEAHILECALSNLRKDHPSDPIHRVLWRALNDQGPEE